MSSSEPTIDVTRNGRRANGAARAPPSGPTCFAAWLSSRRVDRGGGEGGEAVSQTNETSRPNNAGTEHTVIFSTNRTDKHCTRCEQPHELGANHAKLHPA